MNASSGNNDTQEAQRVISEVFEQAGRKVEFLMIEGGLSIALLAARAVSLAQAQGGVVVAAGGDGTINAVAGAVLGSGCPFGVLPQGTFNYFGRANAIPQETRAAALALVGACVTPVQVGQVNGKVFLVNASLGLYPQLLEDREAWKQQLGRSRAVAFLSGLMTLVRYRRQLKLEVDLAGRTTTLRTPTLFVGNNHLQLERVGIDAQDAGAVKQGGLAAIVLRPIGSLALLGLLLRGVIGRLGDAENVDSFSFRRLTVRPRGKRRIKVATDGEIVWMNSPLVFEVSPKPLLLLVPAPQHRVPVE